MSGPRRAFLAALLVCACAAHASAQYRLDPFTTSNGLPQNTVSAVLQTRDGYVWIATYDGLVRFDGVRFTTFDKGSTPAIRSAQFLSLFEDRAGTLWAGTVEGGVVRYRHGEFTTLGERDGLVRKLVHRIQESPAGVVLFHTDGVATLVRPDGSVTGVTEAAAGAYVGRSGATWTHENGRITRALKGEVTAYAVDLPLEDFARLRYEARDGSLWIGLRAGGVYRLAGGAVSRYGEADGVPERDTVRIGGDDLEGRVWLQSKRDVLIFERGRFTRLELDAGDIRAVAVDRENTVWVGTNSRGLIHVVPDVLRTYSEADGLPSAGVYPLAEDRDGAIFAGSVLHVSRWSKGVITSTPLPRAARALLTDADGTLWIGSAPGLLTLKDGRLTDRSALVSGHIIDALLRTRSGALWAGGPRGLFRIEGSVTRSYGAADGLPGMGIAAMIEDRAGHLWVATTDGVARLDGDRFAAFGPKDGLAGDHVRALYEDASGAMWIGTYDSGLSRFKDGRFTSFTTQTGLFSNGVFAIVEDDAGWFWMSSNRGIFRVPRQHLEDVAAARRTAVASVVYGIRDGMLSVECNGGRQSAGLKARDGRLWFPTQAGLVAIDPARASPKGPAPHVTIESVLVDGAVVRFDDSVRVEPGQQDVEINYTAPSFFKAEHIQFRYALDGLNAGWIDAGTRRTLHYSHLAPGSYTFRIQAADTEGRWTEGGTAVRFVVRPAFYQTAWFSAAVLLLMAGAGASLVWLRVHRLQEAERILTTRIGEATAELASANRRLEQLATIDELTQLANRRRFGDVLEQEWQRAVRERTPIGLLMLDVDFFKRYNDTHGHQAGDACLQRVGAVLLSRARRPSDLAARYGGEEFAVILPGVDEAGALAVGEWIRAEVERQGIPHGASDAADVVTVSMGAALATPAAGTSAASLVAAADAALYRAKEQGRNRVIAGMMDTSPDAGAAATRLSGMRIHHPGS